MQYAARGKLSSHQVYYNYIDGI